MSSQPPPNPISSTFNLRDWIQAVSSGLSLATASTYFLSKLVADTAQGLITFTTGIVTSTISPYGAGTQSIFTDSTNLRTSTFGQGCNFTKFGPLCANLEIGTETAFNVKIGQNMPSRSGNTIAIGSYPSQDTNIGIGTRSGGDIYSGTNKIIIGGTGNVTAILSDSTLIQNGLTTNSIQPNLSTDVLAISSTAGDSRNVNILNGAYTGTQVKGNINIMTGSCAAGTTGGTVAIQTNNTAGVCNIGNPNSRLTVACPLQVMTGNDSAGNVNILSATYTAGATAGTVSILSGSHNATATGGDINIHSGSCKGTMILGNSVSTLNLNAGTINLNKPLTVGYAPSAITASTQIGYTVRDTITFTGGYTTGISTPVFNTPITLPQGVWLIQFTVRVRSSGTSTTTRYFIWGQDSITGDTPTYAMSASSITQVLDNEGLTATGCFVVSSTGSTTYNVYAYFFYTGSTINIDNSASYGSVVKRTRLA